MKRALDALKDFRIDVEEGEEMVRTIQPVHIDRTKPRPPAQTIRLRDVRLKSGDVTTAMEVNTENGGHASDAAVMGLAIRHVAQWLNEQLKGVEKRSEELFERIVSGDLPEGVTAAEVFAEAEALAEAGQ